MFIIYSKHRTCFTTPTHEHGLKLIEILCGSRTNYQSTNGISLTIEVSISVDIFVIVLEQSVFLP